MTTMREYEAYVSLRSGEMGFAAGDDTRRGLKEER